MKRFILLVSLLLRLTDLLAHVHPQVAGINPQILSKTDPVYSASKLGIVGDGKDQTAKINSIVLGGQYRFIAFDYPVPTAITISGIVQAAGITFIFLPGNTLTGTGTINNAVITAGNYKITDVGLTWTNMKTTVDKVYADWWGSKALKQSDAIPASSVWATNRAALQKAIDVVISNPTLPNTVKLSPGYYDTDRGLIVYDWRMFGGQMNYAITSCSIEGSVENNTYGLETYGTWIRLQHERDFAIGFQAVKSAKLKWINFTGKSETENYYTPDDNLFTSSFTNFISNYNTGAGKNILDSRTAMHAAVVIDPFCAKGNQPAMPFPNWTNYQGVNWYRGTNGGSSHITLEEIRVDNFVVAFSFSPNGTTQNAEDMRTEKTHVRSCKVALSMGQSENKNFIIEHMTAYSVHTLFDNFSYGQGIGGDAIVSNVNFSNCVRFCNLDTQRESWSFKNIYTEQCWKIGDIGSSGNSRVVTTFINSKMEFAAHPSTAYYPDYILKGSNVHFIGGYIRFATQAPDNSRLIMHGKNITFDNVAFEAPPIFLEHVDAPQITNGKGVFRECPIISNAEQNLGFTNTGFQMFKEVRHSSPFGSGSIYSRNVYDKCIFKMHYRGASYDYGSRIGGGTLSTIKRTLPLPSNGQQATFTLSGGDAYLHLNINDHIMTDVGGTKVMGRISSINGLILGLRDVPQDMVAGPYGTVWYNHIRKLQIPFTADISSGNAVLTNVKAPFGYPEIGDRIETYGGVTGWDIVMKVIAISTSNFTITVSGKMTHTERGATFAIGDPEMEITSLYDVTDASFPSTWLFKGMIVKVKRPYKEYRVTVAGTKTTATFVQIY